MRLQSPSGVLRRSASLVAARPVTPEVAGSIPVVPVENILQIGSFRCLCWRERPPAVAALRRCSRTSRKPFVCRYFHALSPAMCRVHPAPETLWDGLTARFFTVAQCPTRRPPLDRGPRDRRGIGRSEPRAPKSAGRPPRRRPPDRSQSAGRSRRRRFAGARTSPGRPATAKYRR
jgi:hypothetical protein